MRRDDEESGFGRRELLFGASALGLGGLLPASANAQAGANPLVPNALTPEIEALVGSGCTVTGSDVQGPFWLNLNLVRQDITEGSPGVPVQLFLRIQDAATCSPIEGAVVDVWQTDAAGDYSGFQSRGTQGLTFLRGIQLTPPSGLVSFQTIYPGWYSGRTMHLHVKVTPQVGTELTTQLYFPQSVNDRVATLPPYDLQGPPPVTNGTDGFFDAARLLKLRRDGAGNGIVAGKTIVVA